MGKAGRGESGIKKYYIKSASSGLVSGRYEIRDTNEEARPLHSSFITRLPKPKTKRSPSPFIIPHSSFDFNKRRSGVALRGGEGRRDKNFSRRHLQGGKSVKLYSRFRSLQSGLRSNEDRVKPVFRLGAVPRTGYSPQ